MHDIVIVGGGVVGSALAYEACRRGASVTLLERDFIGSGSSGVAAGMLAPQAEAEGPGPLLRLGLASREMFTALVQQLHEDTGASVDLDLSGILRLAHEEASALELHQRAAWQRELGLELRHCTPDEVRELAPGLSKPPRAALWLPDGCVDAFGLTRALALAARARGAAIREGVTVLGLGGGEVRTTEGRVCGAAIVLTAGAWTGPLTELPITPVKGQRLLLRVPGPPPCRLPLFTDTCYLVPKAAGHWLVGATMEPGAGFDRRITLGAIGGLARAASELCLELEGAEPVECRAGLRPCAPDGLPLLGPLPAVPGVWVAAGHARNGILLAPLTARVLAEAILQGGPLPPECAADRFAKGPLPQPAPSPTQAARPIPAPTLPEWHIPKGTPEAGLELSTVLAMPPLQAWNALTDVHRWQTHMPDVRRIAVIASGDGWRISEWTVAYLGQEVRWRQRDEIDAEQFTIRSRQVEGTLLRRLEIDCQLAPLGAQTRITLGIRLDVARFPGLILPAVREVIRRNYAGLIAGVAAGFSPGQTG